MTEVRNPDSKNTDKIISIDKDLVELAGYQAYFGHNRDDKIT